MADPYAEREGAVLGDRPEPDAAVGPLLKARGGLVIAGLGDHSAEDLAAAKFCAITRRDDGLLPPLARIPAALAVALLADSGDSAERLASALSALEGAGVPLFLVKDGLVAGPAGTAGVTEIAPEQVAALLDAALAEAVAWEQDPDFGYEVAAGLPAELASAAIDADALCPRLIYAAADRVYEHADLVVAYKQAWHDKLKAIEGLDPLVLAASGWPVEATGQSWKD